MAFLAAAAVLSAVLITLAPAGRLAGMRLAQASRGQASSDARGSRLRSGLVAMQIGACALFLVGAVGLLDESSRLANPQLNLSYERVSLIGIDPKVRAAVATRLASEAAVEQVAVTWKPPLMAGPLPTARVTASATSIAQNAGYTGVSPEYFTLFDIQIVRGRTFTPAEAAAGAAVALVSEATAAALWPGLDPLGQTLDLAAVPEGRSDRRLPRGRVQVIGVTEDVVNGNIFDGVDASCVYFPTDVQPLTEMSLLVRTRTDDVEVLRSAVATAVKEVAPETPFQLLPMRTMVGRRRLDLSGLLGGRVVTRSLSACSSRTRGRMPSSRSSWPSGRASSASDGARCQRLADRVGDAGRDVSHRLDRPGRRVGGRGRPARSVQRLSLDPAGLRCPSFCGRRRDRARRDGRGRAIAAAQCRADRSCASASNGVTFVQ